MIDRASPLVLGSASPRRKDILEGLGLPVRVAAHQTEELSRPGEPTADYLARVVLEKLAGTVAIVDGARGAFLAADTIVVLGDEQLGKPADVADAATMVGRLVGRTHEVLTRYAIGDADGRLLAARTVSSLVTMRSASASEIERYAATGEGLDKAGAYAAQGIGAFLVERIDGSYTNVVGLPACEVVRDLTRVGLLGPFP